MPEIHEETVLQFEDVRLQFADSDRPALDGISFALAAGHSCVIMGAAGSGKTVLLKTAVGLLKPDSGRVRLFREEITRMSEKELFRLRAKVGILFQEGGLFDSLTIEENVAYPLVNQPGAHFSPEEVRRRVVEALRLVELDHTLEKFPSELSGGMRRRVGIARANVTEPPLVLYDSPTAGLDPITAHTIMGFIIKERDTKNTTTVMVTHRYQDGNLLAKYRYNQVTGRLERATSEAGDGGPPTRFMVLREGKLVFEGTQQELEASADPYVRKFLRTVGG